MSELIKNYTMFSRGTKKMVTVVNEVFSSQYEYTYPHYAKPSWLDKQIAFVLFEASTLTHMWVLMV